MMSYFIVFVLAVGFSYLLGNFFIVYFFNKEVSKLKQNDFVITSLSISIGLIILITLIAVIFTFLKTVYLWSLLLLLIPLFKYKRLDKEVVIPKIGRKNLLITFIIVLFIFVVHLITFYNSLKLPHYDFMFMGKISSGLLRYHTENLYAPYGVFSENSNQFLYHYSELWLTGLICLITHLSETKVLMLVVYPLLSFATLMASIAIFSSFSSKKIIYILGGFGLVYGTKFFLPVTATGEFWELVEIFRGVPIPSSSKLWTIYFIAFTAMLLYVNDQKKLTFILFSFIPIFYPTTIPSFMAFALGLIVIHFFFHKKLNWQIHRLHYAWYIVASIIFIILYKNVIKFELTTKFELAVYPIKTYLVVFVETIIKVFLEHFVITAVFVYFILKTRGKILFNPIVLVALLGLFGAFCFIQTQSTNVPDINQVINNVSSVLICIAFIEMIRLISSEKIIYIVGITTLFGIYNISYTSWHKEKLTKIRVEEQSENFSKKVIHELEKQQSPSKVCSISLHQPTRWYYDSDNPFDFILMSYNINTPLEIGVLFYGDIHLYQKNYLNNGYPPSTFFKEKEPNEMNIYSYLNKSKIEYVLIENYKTISDEFLSKMKLICLDEKSKKSFWKVL